MSAKKLVSVCSYSVQCIFIFCAALMLLLSGCSSVKSVQAPDLGQTMAAVERQTTEGIVIGEEYSATNTISWKAIPYARPPVGDLRWKAPQLPAKTSGSSKSDHVL